MIGGDWSVRSVKGSFAKNLVNAFGNGNAFWNLFRASSFQKILHQLLLLRLTSKATSLLLYPMKT